MTKRTDNKVIPLEIKEENEFDILGQSIESGNCFLIEASAGTGKTFNIQHLYLRALLERGLNVGEILTVTFTEAATAELRTRIRNNLLAATNALDGNKIKDETLKGIIAQAKNKVPVDELRRRLRLALLSFDEAAIFTIHGFCSRMLNENAFESRISFDLELIENQDEILMDIVADFWRRNFYGKNEIFATALDFCQYGPDKLLDFAKLVTSKPDLLLIADEAFNVSDIELIKRIQAAAEIIREIKTNAGTNRKNVLLMDQLKAIDLSSINDTKTAIRVLTLIEKNTITAVNLEKKTFNDAVVISIKKALYDHLRNDKPLETRKRMLRMQSYDDMLLDLRSALRDKAGRPNSECDLAKRLRERYKAAMIDEFQDTDPVQCEIFNTLFRHADSFFVMIGDPKQSIYRFRSADIYSYLDAKDNKNTESRTLTENFRSAQALLNGVNELFSGDNPFLEEQIPYIGVRAGKTLNRNLILPPGEREEKPFQMDWVQTDNDKGIAKSNVNVIDWTADRIVNALKTYKWEMLDENGGTRKTRAVKPKDIAILVPMNKYTVQMQASLKRRGVPAVISNSGNVFESEMAKEVYFLLRAIQNPGNTLYLKTALGGILFCFPEKTLIDFADTENASVDNGDRLAFWADRFKEYRADWEKKGVMPMLSSLTMMENLHPNRMDEKGKNWTDINSLKKGIENLADAKPGIDGLDERERNIVDMRHLMELLHRTESEQSLSPSMLLSWLQRRINGSSQHDGDADACETRLETDREAVTIMTIHKSKGLQFPLVFSPLLWASNYSLEKKKGGSNDWTCHLREDPQTRKSDLILPLGAAKDAHKQQGMKEALGELLRVAYVATTRAEHFCCLLYGNFSKDSAKTALNYLIKKNQRGEAFIEDKKPPVGNEPPDFNSIQVFPFNVSELEASPTDPMKYQPSKGDTQKFESCELRKDFRVPKNWGIMSYSSLGQHRGSHVVIANVAGGTDETEQGPEATAPAEKESPKAPILPGGKKTGSCFHEIMEKIDFRLVHGENHDKWSQIPSVKELIEGKMRKYGLIRGKRSEKETADSLLVERYPLICKLIHQTLTAQIPAQCGGKAFSLNTIEKSDHISEMEFFYEVQGEIDKSKLKEIANSLLPETAAAGENELENESGNVMLKGGTVNTGFMNGSIDIVFRKDGRYCFADWKTNTLEDYDRSTMWSKMFSDSFILQHLIYSLTLDLYLNKRLKNYDFEKHFGGGYYIFVRGLEPDGGKGLLANRIGKDTLTQLRKCIHSGTMKNYGVAQ